MPKISTKLLISTICLLIQLVIGVSKAATEHTFPLIQLKGQKTQGSLLIGQVKSTAKVIYQGKHLRITPKGFFVIGFGRDADLQQSMKIITVDNKEYTEHIQLKKRNYQIQRIDGIPNKKVNPDKKALARIKKENQQIAASRLVDRESVDFLQEFIWPLEGPISGVYGSQRVFNGQARRPHFGVDVAAPVGTKVKAPADGIVTFFHEDMFFSGGTMVIDHGYGVTSSFLHLDKSLVKVGTKVKQGQMVAEVGKTGRVTGPHLDWRINWFKVRIDPQLLVPEMAKDISKN